MVKASERLDKKNFDSNFSIVVIQLEKDEYIYIFYNQYSIIVILFKKNGYQFF